MHTYYIAGLIFLITASRFVRRFRKESKRQEAFTWPSTRVALPEKELQFRRKGDKASAFAALTEPYHFFYRGEKTEGKSLVYQEPGISAEQQKLIATSLEERRDRLTVRFNPDKPQHSAIQLGFQELSWWRTLSLIFMGIIIPAFLIYSYQSWLSAPANWQEAIQFLPQ